MVQKIHPKGASGVLPFKSHLSCNFIRWDIKRFLIEVIDRFIPFFVFLVKVTKNEKVSCHVCLFSVKKIHTLPENERWFFRFLVKVTKKLKTKNGWTRHKSIQLFLKKYTFLCIAFWKVYEFILVLHQQVGFKSCTLVKSLQLTVFTLLVNTYTGGS